jgi:hypothetical protein
MIKLLHTERMLGDDIAASTTSITIPSTAMGVYAERL